MIPTDNEYSRGIIQGIVRYISIIKPWLLSHWAADCKPASPFDTNVPEAFIATIDTPQQAEYLSSLDLPCINVSSALSAAPFSSVIADDVGAGELAATHFLQRGLKHFAFIGIAGRNDSNLRRAGYVDRLTKEGVRQVNTHEIAGDVSDDSNLNKWVSSLRKPCGIFAMDDNLGRRVVDATRALSGPTSRDFAVLGCGNDPIICGLALPRLTSVSLPGERVGYDAAALLDRLLNGEQFPIQQTLLPVSSVVPRSSTDIVSIDDPDVAAAMRFILAHAGEWIGVPELLLAVPVQRRTLERKFRHVLGRSPLEEIRRVRLETAQELLANTDLPMPIVARRSGFSQAKQLSLVFRSVLNTTPTEYRARFRIETTQPPA
ncbi:MAG: substrate-binding domain-containing protein [Planctomycetota bacterium]|nr:substrate-binding domain-containing protein [Planctomycetota bacterium]